MLEKRVVLRGKNSQVRCLDRQKNLWVWIGSLLEVIIHFKADKILKETHFVKSNEIYITYIESYSCFKIMLG